LQWEKCFRSILTEGATTIPDGRQVPGYQKALFWKLTSRREPPPRNAIGIGLKTGLVIGGVTAISGAFTSAVEWGADQVPAKSMGVFGVGLILIGFALQSPQHWVALLDVQIRSYTFCSFI
jgi:hypothetical protein